MKQETEVQRKATSAKGVPQHSCILPHLPSPKPSSEQHVQLHIKYIW